MFQFEQFQFFQLKQPTLVIRTCNFEFSLSVLLVFLVFSVSHYFFLDVLLWWFLLFTTWTWDTFLKSCRWEFFSSIFLFKIMLFKWFFELFLVFCSFFIRTGWRTSSLGYLARICYLFTHSILYPNLVYSVGVRRGQWARQMHHSCKM